MIEIDGSEGEGGGQMVRNACALSLVTGTPFSIKNIRGNRSRPGLMRQHVTAVEAAAAIGGVECQGLAVGSSELVFRPGKVSAGDYHFAVGTAGSTSLVLQTILLPLILTGQPSRLVLEGGTHNMLAPPFDFIERVFLPVINRMGGGVSARLIRHGFYPRGGGRVEIDIVPPGLNRVDCIDRGAATGVVGEARVAGLAYEIAKREIETAQKVTGWDADNFVIRELPEDQGPGNILLLEAMFEQACEIVSGFGQLGVSAHQLAKKAAQRMNGYIASGAFAGPYLADQLLLPFALAGGGSFTTVKPSQHSRTAADIIEAFLGRKTQFEERVGECWLVTVR